MKFDELVALVYAKNLPELTRLKETGVDLDVVDRDGRTLLMHAVLDTEAQPEVVRWLLANGAKVDHADRAARYTALHFSTQDQRRELVEILLAAGASIDPLDAYGNSPLWRAVMNSRGDLDLIRILVSKGAKPDLENKRGVSPRKLAKTIGSEPILAIFDEPSA